MDSLATEILLQVFAYLWTHEKALAARVCARWKDIVDDNKRLWRQSKIQVFKPLEMCHLEIMNKWSIRTLTVQCKMSTYNFLFLMRSAVHLEYLDISHNVDLSYHTVNLALLYGERKYLKMFVLNISYCRLLNDYAYVSIFWSMPNLTEINLSGCSLITDKVMHFLPSKEMLIH